MSFNPNLPYATVTDIDGSIFAIQGGRVYDQKGNVFNSVPNSQQRGFTAPGLPERQGVANRASLSGPNVAYIDHSKYARIRSAVSNVRDGTGYAKVVLLGDSTMMGAYSTGTYPNPVEGCRPFSMPSYFAASLQSHGIPVYDAAMVGDHNVSAQFKQDGTTVATLADYDTSRTGTVPAGYSSLAAGNVLSLGANMMNGSGSNSFIFRPFEPCDTADVWIRQDAGLATNWTITRSVTGDSLLGLSAAGTAAYVKKTLTCAASSVNFFSIQRISGGGNLFISMVDCYDSSVKCVRVYNAGWSASRCSDWRNVTSPWSHLNALLALNPDLVVIQPGINEYNNAGDQTGSPSATVGGQFPATYQADLDFIVSTLLTAGINVILRTHFPSQNSIRNLVMQRPYAAVTRTIAAKYGLALDDLFYKITTWEHANQFSWYSDGLHPTGELYRRAGESLAAVVQAVAM